MSKKLFNKDKSIKGFKTVAKSVKEDGFKTINETNNGKLNLGEKFKFTFQMFRDVFTGKYREFSLIKLILSILAVIYVVSPIDIIPDVILGLGWIDDGTIFLLGWNYIKNDVLKYSLWKNNLIKVKTDDNDDNII